MYEGIYICTLMMILYSSEKQKKSGGVGLNSVLNGRLSREVSCYLLLRVDFILRLL